MTINIYVASRTTHALKWQRVRDNHLFGPDIHINSTWIDSPYLDLEASLSEDQFIAAWDANLKEIDECDLLLVYHETGEILRSALIEVGYALRQVPILICAPDITKLGSWTRMGEIYHAKTFNDIIPRIRTLDL